MHFFRQLFLFFSGRCLDPFYLLVILALFLLSVIALAVSFYANRCHRKDTLDT